MHIITNKKIKTIHNKITNNKEDIEISVESAMRLYLGIDCFSGVLR